MENKPILFVINELLWSSSSESSDDSDSADENTRTGKRPRILNYVEEVVDKFSEREFRENFRLRRNTFTYLLNQLKDHISTSLVDKGHPTIDAKKQLLIALWYFATPDSYRSICSRFDIGKATGIRCAVCNHRLLFTHCYAGEVGSIHDATVLRRSEIWEYMTREKEIKFPRDTHIIGDKAYPCTPQLLTPYKDNGHLTVNQKRFNYRLSKCRSTIERAFALLKQRFRILKFMDVRRLDWAPKYIIACCILHNICIQQEDILEVEEEVPIGDDNLEFEENVNENGFDKRNRICGELI
ncbi:hypothetical protein MML48_4g00003145 [Holotrichia oblita]|uniref:Uncharacterized protein n=1 Tax=Holotrichia oblita TaxID=644536 RepID=A0ACB9T8E3_HOLOL|nr:hypothetical protein MML48_4g00003145 [Holotrichia oblita]